MKIVVVGDDGHMGGLLLEEIAQRENMEAVSIDEDYDVLIDFSYPGNLDMICKRSEETGKPAIIATTGYSEEQVAQIKELATKVPVVYTANFSMGVTVMKKVLQDISPVLKDAFDMEMVERHHNRKVDAPSGTAKMLVEAMDPDHEFERVEGRSGMRKREKEIGVHAVRGGTIAGVHTAIYAGDDEILEIKHTAGSRKIFVNGSLTAAAFAMNKEPGLYDMSNVLFGE